MSVVYDNNVLNPIRGQQAGASHHRLWCLNSAGSLPQLDIHFSMTTDMEKRVLMLAGLAPSNGKPEMLCIKLFELAYYDDSTWVVSLLHKMFHLLIFRNTTKLLFTLQIFFDCFKVWNIFCSQKCAINFAIGKSVQKNLSGFCRKYVIWWFANLTKFQILKYEYLLSFLLTEKISLLLVQQKYVDQSKSLFLSWK